MSNLLQFRPPASAAHSPSWVKEESEGPASVLYPLGHLEPLPGLQEFSAPCVKISSWCNFVRWLIRGQGIFFFNHDLSYSSL